MHNIYPDTYIEHRQLRANTTLSLDLARHLFARQIGGNMAVICDQPEVLMSVVVKQWRKVERLLQKERARTLQPGRITMMAHELTTMQQMHFFTTRTLPGTETHVSFMTLGQDLERLADCHTLYVTLPVNDQQLDILSKPLLDHALIVLYG